MDDDQVIDPATARALQIDMARAHALSGWIVMRGPPDYPDKFAARLVAGRQTPYVLLADSLNGLRAMLPPRLVRTGRQPAEAPEVVEIWFAA